MAKIYAITDDVLTPENSVLEQTRELLECGVKFLQYRTKLEPKNERVALALKELCERYGARFIVNDDVKFAAKIGANAVHIGKDDGGSYAAFGALFASPTKPNAPLCKFETIMRAKEILRIPVCVIGGINAANIAQIAALNPDYIAVISALYRPASIKENLRNLQAFL